MRSPWAPIAFLVLGLLGGVAIALGYSADQRQWATSLNAEVWAPTYQVSPQADGLVTSWQPARAGGSIASGAHLGVLQGQGRSEILRAPHSGKLVGDFGYQGDLVQSGQELALVADLHSPYVLAYIDESYAGKLATGQQADVTFASDPGRTVLGKVARIYPAVAQIIWPLPQVSSGTNFSKSAQWVPVRIDFPQGASVPGYLGMTATVRIAIGGGGS
ncbi:MAG: efflux RND transporter periplasmic adaptor subunit [Thermaerobacter sp.]|nr:efflux RND transporter periplasmic adaptor subunit [Thermaerobacter sp.]